VGKGARGGVRERRGGHKARLTPEPPPTLCKAAWDQRPAGWINSAQLPLPAQLPPKGRPLPPKCTQERMTALDLAPTQPRRPPPRGGQGPGRPGVARWATLIQDRCSSNPLKLPCHPM
ncbi:unnamed protein product, partial [Rangifer tarandus platyrhynchus]